MFRVVQRSLFTRLTNIRRRLHAGVGKEIPVHSLWQTRNLEINHLPVHVHCHINVVVLYRAAFGMLAAKRTLIPESSVGPSHPQFQAIIIIAPVLIIFPVRFVVLPVVGDQSA